MPPQRAFLIDGTAFSYRAFYAIRALSTSSGRPTNAVYGFVTMLQALREKERPDYLAVAFDVGKPTFRHKKFAQYKIQRKPMPDPLIQQIPVVKAVLDAYRVPVFEQAGYEAEDVLATIARRIVGRGVEVYLVTGDKDALQLVNSHIKVYNPHKEPAVLDAAAVQARYGVGPHQVVDLLALMGDETDNIPGVPGIGEKTATQLLQRFETLERLYARLDELESPARRGQLKASQAQVELARELATIDADVPLEVQLEDLSPREPDWRALRGLFRELEFRKLLRSVEAQGPSRPGAAPAAKLLESAEDLGGLIVRLNAGTAPVALMCWPAAGPGMEAVLGLAQEPEEAWIIRVSPALMDTPAGRALAGWLADAAHPKLSHDIKASSRALARLGVRLEGIAGDTMLAAHLINPARNHHALSDVCDEYLDEPLGDAPEPAQLTELNASPALEAFGRAVCVLPRLHAPLQAKLESDELLPLYTGLELPLVRVLGDMEDRGIAVDLPYLAGLQASMQATLTRLTQEIERLAGCAFNLNSPKQLARVLFEQLKLPVVKRTKTGPSTDSDVLRELAEQHPLPRQLLQYRELSKLVSTYVDALPKLVDARTGRIHTSFNQTATATGRLSSSEPNLQNIPIKTELGRSIRRAFVPGVQEGVLVAADYSQIELRVLAHLAGDPQLLEAFRQGHDIHRFTASLIYGVPEADVQPEQRYAMKAVNYGILYGMTSHGLSRELGVSFEEAQAFIDAYFERYPRVREYLQRQIEQAKQAGFVQTLLGRRRYIPELASPEGATRQFGERMAVNAPIQGTAADLIKRAMLQLDAALGASRLKSRMLLQVHDELVLEGPRAELPEVSALVRRVMEGAMTLSVPLDVTVKAGPNWLDLSPVA